MNQRTQERKSSRQQKAMWLFILVVPWMVGLLLTWTRVGAQSSTPVGVGYRDFSYGNTVISTPTGEKPESKLWWNDGSWWGVLYSDSAGAYHIYRLDLATQSWVDTGTAVDDRSSSKADTLWDDSSQKLYVVSHIFTSNGQATASEANWGRLYRYSYDSITHTYSLDAGFPVTVTQGKSETLVLAKDSTGQLWVTYVEGQQVMVNRSLTTDLTWGTPFVLPVAAEAVNVSSDDISSTLAFQGDKVGIMWSNQSKKKVYFSVHLDGDADIVWGMEQVALPGPPNCLEGEGCADDHVNLKSVQSDGTGRVVAAVKTSLSASNAPLIMLLVRGTEGTWNNYVVGRVSDGHTRPIVLLDEENDQVYVFATAPETGGAIYVKKSDLNGISFPEGVGDPFIQSSTDTLINNSTSTKQNVNSKTGLVVLASDQNSRYYLHNYSTIDAIDPPIITDFTPTSGPEGTSVAIAGVNLAGVTDVAFNGTPSSFAVNSDTEIVATVPVGATTGPISAINAVGTGVSPINFTVTEPLPPTIDSFSPTNGPPATSVTITGSNFAGTTEVAFNGVVAPSFAVVSDIQLDTVVPAEATTGPISVTNAGGTSTSTQDFTVTAPTPPPSPTRIKNITFEDGSLVHAASGADQVVGGVVLETISALKGNMSASFPNVSNAYLDQNFTDVDEIYISFYLLLNAVPASDTRILSIRLSGSSQIGNIYLLKDGRIRLRNGSSRVGSDTQPLVPGQLYRIGMHQKKGSGTDAVLEAFLAEGDESFGIPFAAIANGTWTTPVNNLRIGATLSTPVDFVMDDIILDRGSMPPPSGFEGPLVASFDPASGPVGTAVTIGGTNLAEATEVTFNGTPDLSFTVDSDIQITATVPTGATSGPITVTNPAGTGTSTDNFIVTGPAVVLAPTSLSFADQEVSTTSPAQTVTLTNAGTAPLTLASLTTSGDFAHTHDCPLDPATLAAGASCSIAITFTPTAPGPHSGTLTVTDDAPDSPQTLPLSGTGVEPPAPPPTVSSVTPNTMQRGTTINVAIVGKGFSAGAAISFASGNGRAPSVSNIVFVDSDTLTADVTAKSGGPSRAVKWDVVVTNPDGQSGRLSAGFTVTP